MKKVLLAFIVAVSFHLSAFSAVNLNTATPEELQTLNGIGPVKAQAIVDYRKKNGQFKTVDELQNVEGIGPATLEKVRKEVAVSGRNSASTPAVDRAKATSPTANKNKAPTETKAKEVGNSKAAESGRTADSKSVKSDKPQKEPASKKGVKPSKDRSN